VKFEVPTAFLMKISIFWDLILYRLIYTYEHFGGAHCLDIPPRQCKSTTLNIVVTK
jgi:hypothetical protein